MILSQIAAMSSNRVIGRNGELPWHIPEDLKYFKRKTKGHCVIMGRKTFASLGTGHPLPHRLNVVVTRQKDFNVDGVHVCHSVEEAIDFCKSQIGDWPEEVFICGGGEIYRQTLDQTDNIYLTIIKKSYEGDSFFPEFDENDFEIVSEETHLDPEAFTFTVYSRKQDQ